MSVFVPIMSCPFRPSPVASRAVNLELRAGLWRAKSDAEGDPKRYKEVWGTSVGDFEFVLKKFEKDFVDSIFFDV